jgi:WD40 repeat protein
MAAVNRRDKRHIVKNEDVTPKVLALGSVTGWSAAGVWSVAFSPDGQRIATGIAGANATVKVWSAAPTP